MIDIEKLRQTVHRHAQVTLSIPIKPQELSELLDRLEAAESECLEQARFNGMGSEREAALMAKLEAAEKERDALRAKIEQVEKQEPVGWVDGGDLRALSNGNSVWLNPDDQGRMVPVYLAHGAQPALMAKLEAAEKERDALRSKIAEMGRQEPVAEWLPLDSGEDTRRD